MGYIYKITNDINDKIYVGQTIYNIKNRFSNHICSAKRNEKTKLYNAMRKYGIEHFSISVIEECKDELLNEREIYFISKLNTIKNGYNISNGGEGRKLISDEIKEKIWNDYKNGLIVKEISKKYNVCCETIYNYFLTKKDYKHYTRLHYLKSNKVKKEYERKTKAIMQFDFNGNFIKKWKSFFEIKNSIKNSGGVKSACQHIAKTACGYQWLYEEEYNKGIRVDKIMDKTIYQFTKDMKLIGKYKNQVEASKATNTLQEGISSCLLGKLKTSNGFIWKYGGQLC